MPRSRLLVLLAAVTSLVLALAGLVVVRNRTDDSPNPVVASGKHHNTQLHAVDTSTTSTPPASVTSTTTAGSLTTATSAPSTTRSTRRSTPTTVASSGARCAKATSDRLAFIDVARANESPQGYFLSVRDFGSGETRVLGVNASFYPGWTSDGCELIAELEGKITAFSMDGNATSLSPSDAGPQNRDTWPVESPNLRFIAFIHANALWVMNADGTNRRQLADLGISNYLPSWSPDSTRIAFAAQNQVFTIAPDGSGKKQLTTGAEPTEFPTWSPDGSQIAFTYEGFSSAHQGVFTVRPDGSGLTQRAPYSVDWRWSADGTRIVTSESVQSNNGGQNTFQIRVTTLPSGASQVFPAGFSATGVTLTPSNNAVVYEGTCEGHDNSLCSLNVSSGASTLLVDYAGSGRPVFAPR